MELIIKKNKLQGEKKRTLINADDALKVVFGGKKQVSMFLHDKSLRFRVDLHGNLLVSNLVNLLNRSFNLKEGFSQRRTEDYKF